MDENDIQDVDLNNEDEVLEDEQEEDKPEAEPVKQEKPKETPEAKKARLERQLKRLNKNLGESDTPSPKSGELDYGQLAFYNTKSDAVKIESDEDIEFLKETIEETGKSQQAILGSKWFQAELKERAETRKTAEAVPKGTKRSGSSSKDNVDYWLAKGILPENTPENQELRRKVVNARYDRETDKSKFSSSHNGSVTRQSQLRK